MVVWKVLLLLIVLKTGTSLGRPTFHKYRTKKQHLRATGNTSTRATLLCNVPAPSGPSRFAINEEVSSKLLTLLNYRQLQPGEPDTGNNTASGTRRCHRSHTLQRRCPGQETPTRGTRHWQQHSKWDSPLSPQSRTATPLSRAGDTNQGNHIPAATQRSRQKHQDSHRAPGPRHCLSSTSDRLPGSCHLAQLLLPRQCNFHQHRGDLTRATELTANLPGRDHQHQLPLTQESVRPKQR
jgi:hypothetical protein